MSYSNSQSDVRTTFERSYSLLSISNPCPPHINFAAWINSPIRRAAERAMAVCFGDLPWNSTIPIDMSPGCQILFPMLKLQKSLYLPLIIVGYTCIPCSWGSFVLTWEVLMYVTERQDESDLSEILHIISQRLTEINHWNKEWSEKPAHQVVVYAQI